VDKITDRARGKWLGILTELGFSSTLLNRKERPCPAGTDATFRFSDRNGKGNYFCRCNPEGKGDGFALLKCCRGLEFKDAAKEVEKVIGRVDRTEQRGPDLVAVRRAMRQIVESAKETPRTEVEAYLAGRGILNPPKGLVQAHTCYGLGAIGILEPQTAMVAAYGVDGKLCTLHLTYIENGKKANRERARVMMTPLRNLDGGSVALQDPIDGVLGVGEGIETSLAAGAKFGVPVHACLNAHQLRKFDPPDGVRKLLIFGDNDASFTGQAAAYQLAWRMRVRKTPLEVEVHIPGYTCDPEEVGRDWNDVEEWYYAVKDQIKER